MDGTGDPEREQALEQYKNKLLESREWEAKLKALRLDIKGLQKDFDTTEENIKALQSVGQIIGEVLKQLDDERCEYLNASKLQNVAVYSRTVLKLIPDCSHCQGFVWPPVCRWVPFQGRQGQVEARYPRRSRYDYPHNYANAPKRSGSARLQHVA